ncbi:cell division protein DivIC [Carnobacterium iners]|uniref:Cell division protein DivIC n=1 Tax=Carnobacterium iners TaxID=1073423 RepID=A0A1X7MQV6_9LACT|nr:septum formation initiator family protein [Carnobacterium iners]SEK98142.1 cell division protein DivIC [Carnobacterium iners]SMH27229.1 cell division protein DivIC [Carnobacterium iners]
MKKKEPKNIARLQNDYTKSKTLQAHREQKKKRKMLMRVTIILLIGSFVIIFFSLKIFLNVQSISKMEIEKQQEKITLKGTKKEQELLRIQVKRLEDEDYVAKLARSQYYLSKDNEIIFSFPEDNAAKVIEEIKEKEKRVQKSDS